MQDEKDTSALTDDQPADQATESTTRPLRNPDGSLYIDPALLRRLQESSELAKKKEERLVAILLRDYPSGVLPAWGVTMCVLYLRENHPDECGHDDWLLNLVQIGDDKQTFLLNDEAQGDVLELIAWITGCTGVSLLEEKYYATLWYGSARILFRGELARRASAPPA